MVSLVFLGAIQFLLLRFIFVLGDGSFLDRSVTLVTGIYMIVLMKSVCNFKDHQSKINYEKYLKYSYLLLILYNSLIIIGVFSYTIGLIGRGPYGTPNFYIYQALACIGTLSASGQVVVLGLLFECTKSMKFGSTSSQLNISDTVTFNQALHYLSLSCGILSIAISFHFLYKFQQLRKTYLLQIAITIIFNGLNLIFRFASYYVDFQIDWIAIIYNWTQFFSLLCYQILQCDLFKLVSVWNRIASPLAIGLSQFVCLAVGIYMIVLMKSVCIIKDHQSKINYEKYLKYSYGLLILYNSLIVIGVFSYAIGGIIRVLELTGNVDIEGIKIRNLNQGLICMGALCASSQVVVLGFLFECIKSMKFGNDMERIRKNPKKDTTK
ncbi:hypothetical protein BC833DRAFT_631130 [Globomyces pollinis-pini]|nr:hypothetical protein BC833DRAFT_631130 [Globomyces pollinis-pini]